ncbi:hypothetical protein K435DRAFT_848724 [Dendrothele bispora CBS 962.96]|uniref:DH domain-containing protein n=1 Tax=Dendrothele bispora (strain CBS 962.96) TaxID=1314807 RepID=A0A4S8MUB7_DENBC|nr:hypothetical protein K435DRAFT_848724 [Dendrothele bispora CBS 962.96]
MDQDDQPHSGLVPSASPSPPFLPAPSPLPLQQQPNPPIIPARSPLRPAARNIIKDSFNLDIHMPGAVSLSSLDTFLDSDSAATAIREVGPATATAVAAAAVVNAKPLPLRPPSPLILSPMEDEPASSTSSLGQQPPLTKRQHALLELLNSELAYASDLALVRDVYIPMALGQRPSMQTVPPLPNSPNSLTSSFDSPSSFSSRTLSSSTDGSSIKSRSNSNPNSNTSSIISTTAITTAQTATGHAHGGHYTTINGNGSSSAIPPSVLDTSSTANIHGPPMTPEDVRIIFNNIAELAAFSDAFCDGLQQALGNVISGGKGEDCVGALFLSIIPALEPPYKHYISNHSISSSYLSALPKTPSLLAYFSQTREKSLSISHAWDLHSLLIKPVQRLLKYPLLLQAILEETEDGHGDKKRLKEAKAKVEEVAREVNEEGRRKEVVRAVLKGEAKKSFGGVGMVAQVNLGKMKSMSRGSKKKKEKKEKGKRDRDRDKDKDREKDRDRERKGEDGIGSLAGLLSPSILGGSSGTDVTSEAALVTSLVARLSRIEDFSNEFARSVTQYTKSMNETVNALLAWSYSFAKVIGLTETKESEAFEAFLGVIRDNPRCVETMRYPRRKSGSGMDGFEGAGGGGGGEGTTTMTTAPPMIWTNSETAPGLANLSMQLTHLVNERIIKPLAILLSTLKNPNKLVKSMQETEVYHVHLLMMTNHHSQKGGLVGSGSGGGLGGVGGGAGGSGGGGGGGGGLSPALLEASNHYLALRGQLARELPKYLELWERGFKEILAELVRVQRWFWEGVRERWGMLWEMLKVEGEEVGSRRESAGSAGGGVNGDLGDNGWGQETVEVWWSRWKDVDDVLATLKICGPVERGRGAKGVNGYGYPYGHGPGYGRPQQIQQMQNEMSLAEMQMIEMEREREREIEREREREGGKDRQRGKSGTRKGSTASGGNGTTASNVKNMLASLEPVHVKQPQYQQQHSGGSSSAGLNSPPIYALYSSHSQTQIVSSQSQSLSSSSHFSHAHSASTSTGSSGSSAARGGSNGSGMTVTAATAAAASTSTSTRSPFNPFGFGSKSSKDKDSKKPANLSPSSSKHHGKTDSWEGNFLNKNGLGASRSGGISPTAAAFDATLTSTSTGSTGSGSGDKGRKNKQDEYSTLAPFMGIGVVGGAIGFAGGMDTSLPIPSPPPQKGKKSKEDAKRQKEQREKQQQSGKKKDQQPLSRAKSMPGPLALLSAEQERGGGNEDEDGDDDGATIGARKVKATSLKSTASSGSSSFLQVPSPYENGSEEGGGGDVASLISREDNVTPKGTVNRQLSVDDDGRGRPSAHTRKPSFKRRISDTLRSHSSTRAEKELGQEREKEKERERRPSSSRGLGKEGVGLMGSSSTSRMRMSEPGPAPVLRSPSPTRTQSFHAPLPMPTAVPVPSNANNNNNANAYASSSYKSNNSKTRRDSWSTTRPKYTCVVIHPCEPPRAVSYYNYPFFNLMVGEYYQVLQEAGHPSFHPNLPLYVDEGEDCLLLCRDQRGVIGWALASFLEPVAS